jgi:AsmA family protein
MDDERASPEATPPARPRRRRAWIAVAALVVVIAAALIIVDASWFRGPLQAAVSRLLQRDFRIDGDIDVDWGPAATVRVDRLRLANAPWAREPTMASAERVAATIRLAPLLRGRLVVQRLEVDRPRLLLERHADGAGNWALGADDAESARDGEPRVELRELIVHGGRVSLREQDRRTWLDLDVESEPAERDAGRLVPLSVRGGGEFRGSAIGLDALVDSPLELRDAEQPYRLRLGAAIDQTRIRVDGRLLQPLRTRDAELDIRLRGADLADLYEPFGLVFPRTPPYELSGHLTLEGDLQGKGRFAGRIGSSDLAGDVALDLGGERPRLKADLRSKRLAFRDLAGFVGAEPAAAATETRKKTAQLEEKRRRTGRLLPDSRYDLRKLRAMDAEVTLDAGHIDAPRLPLDAMQARLTLRDGLLELAPVSFDAAGGALKFALVLDAREDPIAASLVLDVKQLRLNQLMPRVKTLDDALGRLSGKADLSGTGNSVAALLGSADGELDLIMGKGRVSNLLLELAGLDVAEGLRFLIGKDRTVQLNCAYADFDIAGGVATAQAVGFDTTDTTLLLRGSVSLRDEALDLTLVPKPRDATPVSLRSPLRIRGTFADPRIRPEARPLLLRGAAVAALAAIAPPAALLGLVDTGSSDAEGCSPAAK